MQSNASEISETGAKVAIAAGVGQIVSLIGLHLLSPEFDPGWRVVSEYAHGHHAWLLSVMFVLGGICVFALAFAIRTQVRTWPARIGLWVLVLSGIGSAGAAFFDIDAHPWHEVCGALGVLGLPIAATMISVSLGRTAPWSNVKRPLLWSANLTWIVLAVFVLTMVLLIVTYTQSGASLETEIPVGAPLPKGVIGVNGWVNRLLVVPYWALTTAWLALRLRRRPQPAV